MTRTFLVGLFYLLNNEVSQKKKQTIKSGQVRLCFSMESKLNKLLMYASKLRQS